jgi:hypothetical protein
MDTRPLPPGWVSQWDPNAARYFYVDTTKNPPVSTWDDPRDAPPPYSSSEEPTNKQSSMPVAMPTPDSYQYPQQQYPQYPQYPSSDSKSSTTFPPYSQEGGYPGGQPQPDSYNPYNQYNQAATSSTSAAAPKKSGGLFSKLGLKPGKTDKPDKNNNFASNVPAPAAALGTAAALGALSHNKHKKKLLGGGLGLGLGGAAAGMLIGHSLFKGPKFGGGWGGCDNDWGGGDWGGDCGW